MMLAQAAKRMPVPLADDAPHLLLVDDDRRIRDLLSRFLSGEGYRVTTAPSAKEARAKLLGLHFDLLILDVMMPGETGFELARFIRTSSAVPIIMLTARHEAESRIEGLQIGADDYVAKPFEPRELVLRIANILKRSAPVPVERAEFYSSGLMCITSCAANYARATRSSISPTASVTCCACWLRRPARPCRAVNSRAAVAP